MIAEFVVAGVTGVIAIVFIIVGFAAVEAGKGGYGHGPFPMVPVPRDNLLLGGGIVLMIIGAILLASAFEVVG